jgi:hypothetical protein
MPILEQVNVKTAAEGITVAEFPHYQVRIILNCSPRTLRSNLDSESARRIFIIFVISPSGDNAWFSR